MAPTLIENESNSTSFVFDVVEWPSQEAYRCHVWLAPEEDGQISAIVLNLPGAGSCGDTEEAALENVKEAVRGIIESYEKDGEKIPWKDSDLTEVPEDARLVWVLVNV